MGKAFPYQAFSGDVVGLSPLLSHISKLRIPVIVFGRDGRRSFCNEAAVRIGRRTPTCFPAFPSDGTAKGIVFFRWSNRERSAVCFSHKGHTLCYFPKSISSAVSLLSSEQLEQAVFLLEKVQNQRADGGLLSSREVCRFLSESLFSSEERAVFSARRYARITDLLFRLLFETDFLLSSVENEVIFSDPAAAFSAWGNAAELLTEAFEEGREPIASLRREGESIFLDVMEETLCLGRCRIPALAEVPEPFVYRTEELLAAFSLACALEMTFSEK